MGTSVGLKCPVCSSDALYRYGRAKSGKQRLKCILCGRQFVPGFIRHELESRPLCPKCGNAMHLYMHNKRLVRFRCSGYPDCKAYVKIALKEVL
jgi:ssDNA-binding Zn-finger/Zn-ribbon topoisomerase 1